MYLSIDIFRLFTSLAVYFSQLKSAKGDRANAIYKLRL